ncbi:DUF2628 domain-containing protein [Candidatus Tisiphia endosymbiont of Beris chalybata]|uniref:DUF2628 domain-containing protein n=1 Tax=Candidatus Tisiphia endosymbiont of Beris chalybata TaxID=3066262 RepID=UPI00312C70FA
MNIYSIYVNPQKKDNNCIIIKQGVSLFAAIFNVGWLLYHRMWLLLIVTSIVVVSAFSLNCECIKAGVLITTMLIFGFCSTDIREYDLERKKYLLQDIILANSEMEAELKFLERVTHQ